MQIFIIISVEIWSGAHLGIWANEKSTYGVEKTGEKVENDFNIIPG